MPMVESIEASMNRDLHSPAITSSSSYYSSKEESGWTIYFEDFIAPQKNQLVAMEEENHSSSKVSDASSHAAVIKEAISSSVRRKRLRLKKRKSMGISFIDDNDALEDTASSPVNSPKVSGMDDSPKDDAGGISEEKGFDSEKCGELKKRGLCLVPLSMFVDFHGH
ncbi:hypothetical protein KSP40_PGU009964 [Platanthera guangdongensis]|uniref:Uncharacterized protein n=1 Tax=Platanthera guangdongensis TaxID=2320717 RepID=A0ABR2M868_9ASPA